MRPSKKAHKGMLDQRFKAIEGHTRTKLSLGGGETVLKGRSRVRLNPRHGFQAVGVDIPTEYEAFLAPETVEALRRSQ